MIILSTVRSDKKHIILDERFNRSLPNKDISPLAFSSPEIQCGSDKSKIPAHYGGKPHHSTDRRNLGQVYKLPTNTCIK